MHSCMIISWLSNFWRCRWHVIGEPQSCVQICVEHEWSYSFLGFETTRGNFAFNHRSEYIILTCQGGNLVPHVHGRVICTHHFPLVIYNDNQSATVLAYTELKQFHACTKHIDIRYHFICSKIEDGTLENSLSNV